MTQKVCSVIFLYFASFHRSSSICSSQKGMLELQRSFSTYYLLGLLDTLDLLAT
jgi:hypothetical protein